jgi:hypothetical protein
MPSTCKLAAPLARLLVALPLALLLMVGQFAAAEHHHADGDSGATCSLCTLAHAPAIETAAQPVASALQALPERPYPAPSAPRAERSIARPSSRAPPRG